MTNIGAIFSGTASVAILNKYGYLAIFILMILESASLPIPSEVILPIAGVIAFQGVLNFYLILVVATLAGIIGITIDYYIAYLLSKDLFYKHLKFFRVKKETLDNFDAWFNRNGVAAVFFMRMVPVLRGLISFPAGFSGMNKKKFYLYSILGSLVWDVLLLSFGFYALGTSNVATAIILMSILAVGLYLIYTIVNKKLKK
ncbi:MAG: DedA family protein [Candidatus Micrarchaeia archaeon]